MTLRFGNAEVVLMSRVPVDSSTKAAAVKHYWQTGSLKGTADKFGVSRNAVYDWVRIAELNVEQAFRASTPGKKTATLSEQNQRLQAQLDDVLGRYHKISQSSTGPAVCARCPRCHRTNLLRNGRVRTKRDGLRQRLWCRTCNVSLYVDYVEVKKSVASQPTASESPSPPSCVQLCCESDPFSDLLPTGALGLLRAFTERVGFFDLFEQHFQVPGKTVDYTPLQKLQTLICSVAVGCEWTKDINHKLRPYPAAAQWLGMEQFPDQSSVNRFLHQLGSQQRLQLELISEQLLQRFGLWQLSPRVDLDIDSTGLMVYGPTYEGIRKGYFPRQRGRRGYRLSLASTRHPAGSEILALFLDPANLSPAARFWDCLYQVAEVLGSLDRVGLILADAACGSGPDIEALLDLNLSFIVKGFAPKTARKFAAQVAPTQWESVDLFTRVCDLGLQTISRCCHPVRTILVELMTQRFDRRYYSHLYTALSPQQADAQQVFQSYN